MKSELQDSVGWDVVNWSKCFAFWEKKLGAGFFSGKRVIEIGCSINNGGLGLWITKLGGEVISTSNEDVEESVRVYFKKANLADRFSFEIWDLNEPWHGSPADVVCCKSVFGGICRNREMEVLDPLFANIRSAMKPGGHFLFAENLRASRIHSALRNRFGAGKGNWRYFTEAELLDCMKGNGFSEVDLETTGFLGAFGRSEWQRNLLGRADSLVCPGIPNKYHYIGFGIAKKND